MMSPWPLRMIDVPRASVLTLLSDVYGSQATWVYSLTQVTLTLTLTLTLRHPSGLPRSWVPQ